MPCDKRANITIVNNIPSVQVWPFLSVSSKVAVMDQSVASPCNTEFQSRGELYTAAFATTNFHCHVPKWECSRIIHPNFHAK